MRCEDLGPDLLARALAQDDSPATGAALDAHLAECVACREELTRLGRDVLSAAFKGTSAPPKALRARILAAVRDDAAARRTAAADAPARSCPDFR